MTNYTSRVRRNEEQLIADLEARIAALKARAEARKVQRDPAVKPVKQARISGGPLLCIAGRQQCSDGADAAKGEMRREGPAQNADRGITDRHAAPCRAASP